MLQALLKYNNKIKEGFGVLEIIIASAIIGIIGFSIIQLGVASLQLSLRAADHTQATFLIQEANDAVRYLKDTDWENNITPIINGTEYFLVWNGTDYSLSAIEPPLIDGKFRRIIIFTEVFRDAGDNISETGTSDPLTKKITVKNEWEYRGNMIQKQMESYIMNVI